MENNVMNVIGVAVAVLCINAHTVVAQTPGDWDNDGLATPADAPGLDQCMQGPGASPSSACSVFLTGEGTVGLASALAFQGGVQAPGCRSILDYTNGEKERGYAGIDWLYQSIVGSQCRITTQIPTLCGGVTEFPDAFSIVYTGIANENELTDQGGVLYWSQVGFATMRFQPDEIVTTSIYTEVNGGWNGTGAPGALYERRFWRSPTPNDAELYRTQVTIPAVGRVDFWAIPTSGPQLFYAVTMPGWAGRQAQVAAYIGEVYNTNDHMHGTQATPCAFSECQYAAAQVWNFVDTSFMALEVFDLRNTFRAWHGVSVQSDTTVHIWDRRP